MSVIAIITASLLLPAIGLVWGWFAMARVREELRGFRGFEGIHFEGSTPD